MCLRLRVDALNAMDHGGAHRTRSDDPRTFYEHVGWRIDPAGVSEDSRRFEDLRAVAGEYIDRCHRRVQHHLGSGQYLLDVASGPLQYRQYQAYSETYARRVCADISLSALHQARRRLGDHGLYVVCDVTDLPFRDRFADAVVSLHTIYHVPAGVQRRAFDELLRVLRSGGTAAVVYSWGRASLSTLALAPLHAWKLAARVAARLKQGRRPRRAPREPTLYFHAHSQRWFLRQAWPGCEVKLHPWRSVSVDFLQAYIHPRLAGRALLRVIYALEECLPRAAAWLGQYPLLVFTRTPPPAYRHHSRWKPAETE